MLTQKPQIHVVQYNAQRLINDVYKYVDIGIGVSIRQDDDGNKYTLIDQVCIFVNLVEMPNANH